MSFDTIEINLVLSKSVQNAMKHVPTTYRNSFFQIFAYILIAFQNKVQKGR